MRKPLFLGFLLASCPTRERGSLRPASQNWDTMEENACLCVENSYIFFVVSIMRRDRALLSRSCDTHSSASRAVDGPSLDTSSYFFTFSGFASFPRPTLETAGTGTSHASLILVVALLETKESSVFLYNREGFHDSSLSKAEVTGVGEVP